MAITHGKDGALYSGANKIASTTQWELRDSVPTADSTAQGDTDTTHLVGIGSWSATGRAHYDSANTTGQGTLTRGASIGIKLYPNGKATGKKVLSGTASVTERSISTDLTNPVGFSFTLTGNGALTEGIEP